MTSILRRTLVGAAAAAVAAMVAVCAHAQQLPPPPGPSGPPQAQGPAPACTRLEAQLAAFDRSSADPARAEQIRRFEDTAGKQQTELDKQLATSKRLGCEGNSFFVLFSSQPQQCGPLNAQIRQMRANLDRIQSDLDRLRGDASPEREGQRRAILVALAQNNCGAQYRAAVAATPQPSGGLFESLFGNRSIFAPSESAPGAGGGYRTICVRTCDGYFYPISFATSQNQFAEDERTCQRSCPAAEVVLFSHRNPGEDVTNAVSNSGQLYTSLPNAFKYRQAFDGNCSCRKPGESWSQALKHLEDTTIEQGDIVVNEQRAKLMSLPRVDAQGRPIRVPPPARPDPRAPAQAAAPPPPTGTPDAPDKPDPNRTVRSVGPTFIPAR